MQQYLIPKTDLRTFKACSHGGVSLKKRRKIARPLLENKVTHVVLKSSKARDQYSFYRHKHTVGTLLRKTSQLFFIEVLDWVNMGNHLHLKVRFKDKNRMKQFLKSFPGLLARKITGAKKGQKFGRFWDGLAYTRVLLAKIEEFSLRGYFEANHRQRELSYKERVDYLKAFNQKIYRLKYVKARNGPLAKIAGKITLNLAKRANEQN
jgi:REP element-mobilizing transposase RayT